MNDRIWELFHQANHPHPKHGGNDMFFPEEFAELIVRECATYMYENYPNTRYEVNYMRKHMGDSDWNKPIGVES